MVFTFKQSYKLVVILILSFIYLSCIDKGHPDEPKKNVPEVIDKRYGKFSGQQYIYKKVDSYALKLDVIYPTIQGSSNNMELPAMLLFHGGGWQRGNRSALIEQAKYFASRGIIAILPEYRIKNIHGTTPLESVKDAKSAVRFCKEHSDILKIDKTKIIGTGSSSGGHLVLACAFIEEVNDVNDNTLYTSDLAALVLFNPVVDTGPGSNYGLLDHLDVDGRILSPIHNIQKGGPPTIIFHGVEDDGILVEEIKYFNIMMSKAGNYSELHLFEDSVHGFFDISRSHEKFKSTLIKADDFLEKHNLLGQISFENRELILSNLINEKLIQDSIRRVKLNRERKIGKDKIDSLEHKIATLEKSRNRKRLNRSLNVLNEQIDQIPISKERKDLSIKIQKMKQQISQLNASWERTRIINEKFRLQELVRQIDFQSGRSALIVNRSGVLRSIRNLDLKTGMKAAQKELLNLTNKK